MFPQGIPEGFDPCPDVRLLVLMREGRRGVTLQMGGGFPSGEPSDGGFPSVPSGGVYQGYNPGLEQARNNPNCRVVETSNSFSWSCSSG